MTTHPDPGELIQPDHLPPSPQETDMIQVNLNGAPGNLIHTASPVDHRISAI